MSTKAEDTQKNILNTARKHFLKDGLTGASLRNIVKDAGLTTGAFYKYYPTKEALFDALTDPYMEHIYQIYDQIVEEFEKLSASDQTRNMSYTSSDGMEQMVDYIYDHYDNFRLLLKCGDSGKFELFNTQYGRTGNEVQPEIYGKDERERCENTDCRGKPYAYDLYGIFFISISDH